MKKKSHKRMRKHKVKRRAPNPHVLKMPKTMTKEFLHSLRTHSKYSLPRLKF